jgi:hypothetical protein
MGWHDRRPLFTKSRIYSAGKLRCSFESLKMVRKHIHIEHLIGQVVIFYHAKNPKCEKRETHAGTFKIGKKTPPNRALMKSIRGIVNTQACYDGFSQ